MLRTKTADRIVCIAAVFMLVAAVCLWGLVKPVQGDGSHTIGYESLLFDTSRVHTIEITADNWDDIIANATAEEYQECTIVIDGENLGQVGIRAKGNTSLSSVATMGSSRYSFKVEFNHYVKGKKYHGLDKLSLNNMIQDATMMKDYLAYTMMGKMGVPSPLCSYAQIIVNGEVWGLYLAVEGIEDAFLERNGMTKGELYKPDSMSFGGGRGNGREFDIENFQEKEEETETTDAAEPASVSDPSEATAATDDPGPTEASDTSGTTAASDVPDTVTAADAPGTGTGMPQDFGNFNPADNSFSGGSFTMPEGMPEMPEGGFSFPGGGFPGSTGDGESSAGQEGSFPQQPGGGGFGGFNFGMGSDDVKLIYTDDDPDSYSNIFNNAKTNISSKDKDRLIASLKKLNEGEDLDSVVNKNEVMTYLAVHNFLCNDDSYTGMMVHNYYLYEENGELTILPWDYNLGFGGFSANQNATSTVNSPIDSPVSSGTTDSRPLISWIFSDEEALAAYHETYDRFISECIESSWLEEEISRVEAMIMPYVEKDPSAFYTMEEFETAISTLKTFCAERAESIRGQLEGTIPSTTQGQRENSEALIDASEISTADMGKMDNGNGQGGGGPSMPGGSSMPDFQGGSFTPGGSSGGSGFDPSQFQGESFTQSSGKTPEGTDTAEKDAGTEAELKTDENAAGTGETQADQRPEQPEGRSGIPGSFPGMSDFPGRTDNSSAWIQTGICAALLLAAILIIRKVRAHNR